MRFGRTTAAFFASQLILSLAGFLATFLIARLLGASALGTYTVAVSVLFWIKVPTNGVVTAINKRVSEGSERGAYISGGLILIFSFAVVISTFVIVFGKSVDRYVGAGVSTLIVALYLANTVYDAVSGALKGQKKVVHFGFISVVERIGRLLLQVGLILIGYEVGGLVIGHAFSLTVAAIVGITLFDVRPNMPNRKHFSRLMDFSRYSWLGSLQAQMFGWMDTTVLAFFVASSFIGIYEVAWTLASTLALISNAVQQTLFPELSDLGTDNRFERIHHYLNEGLVFTGILVIPGFFGAVVLGPSLLQIYRPEFREGATILLILIAARGIAAFGSQFLSVINALDRPDITFKINGSFVITNLTLNAFLIWQFGWYGAAAATMGSACLMASLAYYGLTSLIGRPSIPVLEIGKQILAASVMSALILAFAEFSQDNHSVTVSLVGTGTIIYATVLVAISARVRQKAISLVPRSIRPTRE